MPNEQLENGYVYTFFKRYWFLLVFLVTMAIAWSEMGAEIKAARLENQIQTTRIEHNEQAVRTLNDKYIEDVTFIKTTLQQIKNQP